MNSENHKLEAVEAYREGGQGLKAMSRWWALGSIPCGDGWRFIVRMAGAAFQERKRRKRYVSEFKLEVLNRVRDEDVLLASEAIPGCAIAGWIGFISGLWMSKRKRGAAGPGGPAYQHKTRRRDEGVSK